MLQTPTAVMTCETPEKMRARAERKGYKNGTKYGSLESQINYDPRFKGLLKTPSAMDAASERMRSRGTSGTSGTLAQEMLNGYVEKRGFILPTPTAGEAEKYRLKYTPGSQMGMSLSAMGASGMLPTPSARDWKGRTNPGIVKEGSGCVYGETLPDTIGRLTEGTSPENDGGETSRLSPLFTEEMMGFPFLWTTLPFLRQDGEPSPSRPTETP